jgi:hypothetical protein
MKRKLTAKTKKEMLKSFLINLRPYDSGHKLIRIGSAGDGGYLVPDDLQGITKCFSPGVDQLSDFEYDCAERGMEVFLADASVESPATEHPNFSFLKKFLGSINGGDFMTLESWVFAASSPEEELLLQMDIEGAEYEVLLSTPEDILRRFRIIVIEFHGLEQLFDRNYFDLAVVAFNKVLKTHVCVHIHPNNYYPDVFQSFGFSFPSLAEFTFIRRDRVVNLEPITHFPHPLDIDCTLNKTLVLPKCWYRTEH